MKFETVSFFTQDDFTDIYTVTGGLAVSRRFSNGVRSDSPKAEPLHPGQGRAPDATHCEEEITIGRAGVNKRDQNQN